MLVKTGPAAIATEVKHPELLTCIRAWHQGHLQRGPDGTKINIPWRTIELVHIESQTVIASIDVDRDEDCDEVGRQIESKSYAYCRPRSRGDTQLVDVKVHFNDGTYTYSETCTLDIDIPPHKPAYGHSGYAGMGKDLAAPGTQLAVQLKGNIDFFHATMGVLKESLGAFKSVLSDQQKELSDRRSHENEMFQGQVEMIKAFREIADIKLDEELKREFSKYKIFALHAAFDKVMKFGPPTLMKLAKSVGNRLDGVDTKKPIAPHERKAFEVLKDLIQEMAKKGKVSDLGNLLEMLKMNGVDPSTVDRLTDVLQEAQVAAMTDSMEEESRGGIGSIFDAEGNLCIPGLQSTFARQKVEQP